MAGIRANATLSEDLISEILVRVPVKSVLRFQSVSKTWLSLIKHPAFVKAQLLHAISNKTDQTLIMIHSELLRDDKFLLLNVDSRQIVADIEFPYSKDEFKSAPYITLVGSANGIVCVADITLEHYDITSIYLWNPAIRQSKFIPLSYGHELGAETFGFGYDPIHHDFKVVRVVSLVSLPYLSAEVYSANKNVWQKVPDPIDIPWKGYFDVCVNGFLCGFGTFGMMMFDLNKEALTCDIKLPLISVNDDARIIDFNNSVAVVILINGSHVDRTDQRLDGKINVWTLDDDACLCGGGVESSWTPMFSIDFATPAKIILGYFSKGDLLLLIKKDDYMWISCNADKKDVKIVPLSVEMAGHHYTCETYKYTESLVSLAGFEQVNWNAGEDDN